MKVIVDCTPQNYKDNIEYPIIWLDKNNDIRVNTRLVKYDDSYYNGVLKCIDFINEQRCVCNNCKWFKQYGVMGFDDGIEICTAQGKYNMLERRWNDKGCCDFKMN